MKNAEELYIAIGNKIREMRKLKEITLEELAGKVERDWSFLSQIERGKSVPSLKTLFLICNALEIPLSELFNGHKPFFTKTNYELEKIVWLLKDKSPSDRKIVTNVVRQILKKK